MKTQNSPKHRWLPIALVPLMSVAVLAGCSSDDDDPVDPAGVVGDANGNDLPDAAEAAITLGTDANADGIDDLYATPADATVTPADSNENGIDDSFEVSITEGTDANEDGIDDDAAAALAAITGGGTTEPPNPDANGNGLPDAVEGGTDANGDGVDDQFATPADPSVTPADTNNNGVDDSFEVALTGGADANGDGIDDAAAAALAANNPGTTDPGQGGQPDGNIAQLVIGQNQGTANLDFDGNNLSGTVTLDESVSASAVWLFTGIAASRDPGSPAVQLNGGGSDFEIPVNLSADQSTQISENLNNGNLFIVVETTDGQVLRSNQILPGDNAVTATFTSLVPAAGTTPISSGEAFMNINTQSGAFSTVLTINLSAQDVDANGDPVTIGAVQLHSGSITGPVLATLTPQDNNLWSATGTLGADDLGVVTSNNAFFNVELNDGNTPGASFLNGQLMVP